MDTIFFLGVGTWLIAWAAALGLDWLARAAVIARPLTLFDAPASPSSQETAT